MNYQNERTKIGKVLYNINMRWTNWLVKHVWLYYVLNLTWGILYTAIGTLIFLAVLIAARVKPIKFYKTYFLQFGDNWGGMNCVFFSFVANNMGTEYTIHTLQHEFGHSFQNALFGPFNIFLVLIPSCIRYWVQTIRQKRGKLNKDYDSIWFEGGASDGGSAACKYLDAK